MSSLRLNNIWKKFGSDTAVAGVSVEVDSQCLALLGPSGCGKTTTINMIAGFLTPDEGEILVDGRNITGVPPHLRNTGMVFQDYALFPHKTVFDNVAFGLRMRSVPRAEREKHVREALALVGLSSLGHRFPDQISGGQRQRVALARALVVRPSILLLDEPLSNLDARLRESLRDEIRRVLDATRITSVFVTHDQSEAFAIADQVALMNGGRIVQIGTARQLYEHPADRFVAEFFGDCNFINGKSGTALGNTLAIETANGPIRAPLAAGAVLPTATALTVAVRPEQVFVSRLPNAESQINCLPATISKVRYLGSATRLELTLHDSTVVKIDQQRSSDNVETGQDVFACWPVEHGVVLTPARAQ